MAQNKKLLPTSTLNSNNPNKKTKFNTYIGNHLVFLNLHTYKMFVNKSTGFTSVTKNILTYS